VPVVVPTRLPKDTHHGWKFIAFGPDGKLYVPVGAPCNICDPGRPLCVDILRMNADGSGREVFARGVSNSVGFDWSPVDGALWFTDNGRDMLGDDSPPDELNRAPRAGLHFGYPFCHGGDLADPEFGARRSAASSSRRRGSSAPHVAAWACASTPARCSRRIPQPGIHRRARLVEPLEEDRLPDFAWCA
jgi:glucose/arabinose dehydrogenase